MTITRTRTRGSLEKGLWIVQDFAPTGAADPVQSKPLQSNARGKVEVITDTVTPGFKKLQASGTVVMSPVRQTSDERISGPSNWTFGPHPVWGSRRMGGDVCLAASESLPGVLTPDWDSKILTQMDAVLTKAYARVASSEADVLVSLAEARQTATMLADPMRKSRDLVDSMVGTRLRLVKKGMNWANASVQAYLEFRFGIQPLIYDIKNLVKAHKKSVENKGPIRLVARASWKDEFYDSQLLNAVLPGTSGSRILRNVTKKARVSAGVLYELTENSDQRNQRLYGYRLADVPAAMYELVPFSFVLDRYINVGEWIKSIIPKPGVTMRGNWVTVTQQHINHNVMDEAWVNISNAPVTTYRCSGGSYVEKFTNKDRYVDLPLPALPSINVGEHSLVQIVDEVALIVQKLRTFDVSRLRSLDTYLREKSKVGRRGYTIPR